MADAKSGGPLGGEGATLQAKLDGKEAEIETYKSEIAETKKMMDENDVPFKEQLGYLKPMNERLAALDGQLAELHKMVTLLLVKGQNPAQAAAAAAAAAAADSTSSSFSRATLSCSSVSLRASLA
eukprot:m.192454 g.192454  ORF g.192454 m.192454 type:complete len:125 (-) comp24950_c0_seq1:1122-1496(-)